MSSLLVLPHIGAWVVASASCFTTGVFILPFSGFLHPIPATVLLSFEWAFFADLFTVLLINVTLSRDNAVAIALAIRGLPQKMRIRVLLVGVTVAVFVLVVATFFAVYLLDVRFLRLVSGVLILWIATVSMSQDPVITPAEKARSQAFWRAIWMVIVADLTPLSLGGQELINHNPALTLFRSSWEGSNASGNRKSDARAEISRFTDEKTLSILARS